MDFKEKTSHNKKTQLFTENKKDLVVTPQSLQAYGTLYKHSLLLWLQSLLVCLVEAGIHDLQDIQYGSSKFLST